MNSREKIPHQETVYERIARQVPEGNWTSAAAQLLNKEDDIEQFIEELIRQTLHPDPKMIAPHTPESLVDSIKKVIDGPNLSKNPKKKAIWEKALQTAIEKSEYFNNSLTP
jgi:hypothetical protein